LHALAQRNAVGIYFNAGNSPVTWMLRLVGTKTMLNVDGLDWKREKWPLAAKKYIQFAEYLATKLPNVSITDSRVVQAYYQDRFNFAPQYIPYGSEVERLPPGETLAKFDLRPQQYILFVGRLVPENHVHHLLEAFLDLETDIRCVIVGDASYAEEYIAQLKQKAQEDSRVILTGYMFGRGYRELGSNALVFVETSGVGGTHPALLEAMALGNCVVVQDTPENLETIGEAGLAYDGRKGAVDLHRTLMGLLDNPQLIQTLRQEAQERAQRLYSWDRVTDAYERLAYQLSHQALPQRLQLEDTKDKSIPA